MAWTPWGNVDLLPGINVGNAAKQLVTGKDYDVLENFSTGKQGRPGQTHLGLIPDVGVRGKTVTTTTIKKPTGSGSGGLTPVSNNRATGGGSGGGGSANAAYLQQQRQQEADKNEALGLKGNILGRRGEVDSLMNNILANIDAQLSESKGKRKNKFNMDVGELVDSLESSIPEIEQAFAALGLSNSTYKGDRVQDTRDAYTKSYEDTDRQLGEDLSTLGQQAEAARSDARTNAQTLRNTFDTVDSMQNISHNDLGKLRDSDLSSKNALDQFRGESKKYVPGGTALQQMSKLDSNYDFGKVLDTFNAFSTDLANPASGSVGTATKAGEFADDKKKKKTEVEVNNPVGASSF